MKTYLIEYNDTEAVKVEAEDFNQAWDIFTSKEPAAEITKIERQKEVETITAQEFCHDCNGVGEWHSPYAGWVACHCQKDHAAEPRERDDF